MKSPYFISLYSVFCLIVATSFLLQSEARAEFYKYKDSSGAVVITNKLEDIPVKYRKRVKVVWDDELEAKDPLARRNAKAEKQRELRESQHEQQKAAEKMKGSDGKTLVISIDEEIGQVIHRVE